jgi:hypothetical protein
MLYELTNTVVQCSDELIMVYVHQQTSFFDINLVLLAPFIVLILTSFRGMLTVVACIQTKRAMIVFMSSSFVTSEHQLSITEHMRNQRGRGITSDY